MCCKVKKAGSQDRLLYSYNSNQENAPEASILADGGSTELSTGVQYFGKTEQEQNVALLYSSRPLASTHSPTTGPLSPGMTADPDLL